MDAEIICLDDYRPHAVAYVECSGCSHRWVATYPTACPVADLERPRCHAQAAEPVSE
jgi:hypothetical protein